MNCDFIPFYNFIYIFVSVFNGVLCTATLAQRTLTHAMLHRSATVTDDDQRERKEPWHCAFALHFLRVACDSFSHNRSPRPRSVVSVCAVQCSLCRLFQSTSIGLRVAIGLSVCVCVSLRGYEFRLSRIKSVSFEMGFYSNINNKCIGFGDL